MPPPVVNNTLLQCTFGVAPSPLTVLPTNRVMISQQPAANMMDYVPMVNVKPFGMCSSLANPTVAGATAAALGVLTPMPCIPATASPWIPGKPTVLIGNMPAVDINCQLTCLWGGVIKPTMTPALTTMLPA